MKVRHPVSISNDVTMVAASMHESLPGADIPCREIDATIFHPPGMMQGQNKLTATVLHQGLPVAQKDHDCGSMIPHLMPDPLALLHTVNSSRKSTFSASTVRMEGTPVAACGGSEVAPMLACSNPVPLPAPGDVTGAEKNTVTFGLTPADVLTGWAHIVKEGAIDVGAGKIASKLGGNGIRGRLLGSLVKSALTSEVNTVIGIHQAITTDDAVDIDRKLGLPLLEDYFSITSGASRNEAGDWTVDWSVKWGGDVAGFEVGEDGEVRGVRESRAYVPGTASVVIEKDGRRTTYHHDDDPAGHGRVTREDIQ